MSVERETSSVIENFILGTMFPGVIGTERHSDVLITMGADAATTVSGILTSTLSSSGHLQSDTATVYNGQGQVVETTDAAGLRTGTIYYADGQVRYTGELKSTVSDKGTSPWYTAPVPSDPDQLTSYLNSLFVSYTSYAFGPIAIHDNLRE